MHPNRFTLFALCSALFALSASADGDDDALWKTLDITQDGWLDGKELNGNWVRFDTDGDHEVTRAEFMKGRAAERGNQRAAQSPEEAKRAFAKLDSSGNGYLSGSELSFPGAEKLDANGDKRITLEEFLGTRPAAPAPQAPVPAAAPLAPAAPPPPVNVTPPAAPVVSRNKVVGLFYMQKYWIATRNLEKAVWYFAPNGSVYVNPESGFSAAELAAHKGNRGTYEVSGGKMRVVWAKGDKWESNLEIVEGGFNFETGMYVPIEPFKSSAQLVGMYEGGSSMSFGGGSTMIAKNLNLRADGTYSGGSTSTVAAGGAAVGGSGGQRGSWQLSGYALTLFPEGGNPITGITFPFDDEKTPIYPDRLFFSGLMYKKK